MIDKILKAIREYHFKKVINFYTYQVQSLQQELGYASHLREDLEKEYLEYYLESKEVLRILKKHYQED